MCWESPHTPRQGGGAPPLEPQGAGLLPLRPTVGWAHPLHPRGARLLPLRPTGGRAHPLHPRGAGRRSRGQRVEAAGPQLQEPVPPVGPGHPEVVDGSPEDPEGRVLQLEVLAIGPQPQVPAPQQGGAEAAPVQPVGDKASEPACWARGCGQPGPASASSPRRRPTPGWRPPRSARASAALTPSQRGTDKPAFNTGLGSEGRSGCSGQRPKGGEAAFRCWGREDWGRTWLPTAATGHTSKQQLLDMYLGVTSRSQPPGWRCRYLERGTS